MIYTSYFGQIKNMPDNFEPICIARWKPKWYTGKALLMLAPSDRLLRWWRASDKNAASEARYARWYTNEVLRVYEAAAIVRIIHYIAEGKTPVLVCFEKDGFCHRHLVAEWLNKNGFKCEEWK